VLAGDSGASGLSSCHWANGGSQGDGVGDNNCANTLSRAGGSCWAVGDGGSTADNGADGSSEDGQSRLGLGGSSGAVAQLTVEVHVGRSLAGGHGSAGQEGQREGGVMHFCRYRSVLGFD
jgi:hypothetical protein